MQAPIERAVQRIDVPEPIAAILAVTPEARSDQQRGELAAYYRSIAPQLEAERKKLTALEEQLAALDKQIPTTLVARTVEPRMIRVLARGNWMDESGEVVEPGEERSLAHVRWHAAGRRRRQ